MRNVRGARYVGATLLGLLVVTAVAAPLLAPYSPTALTGASFQAPSHAHLLGTNDIGQDILSEVIYGTRISLGIGVLAATVALVIGTTVGCIAGYLGGLLDSAIMRSVDLFLVLPFLPLMIVLTAYVGPSVLTLVVVIGVLGWARPARVIRSQALSVAESEYVVAARAAGAGRLRILAMHVLPGVSGLVVAEFVLAASRAILLEAALSFLGLGDPVQKSWGSILFYAESRGAFLTNAWKWWVVPPGLCITFAALGFALVGLGTEERFNPRLRRYLQEGTGRRVRVPRGPVPVAPESGQPALTAPQTAGGRRGAAGSRTS